QSSLTERRLVEVNRVERERQQQLASQARQAAAQRVRTERDLILRNEAATRTNAVPRRVEVNVPRSTATFRQTERAPIVTSPTPHRPAEVWHHGGERILREVKPALPQPRPAQQQVLPRIESHPRPTHHAAPAPSRPIHQAAPPAPRPVHHA